MTLERKLKIALDESRLLILGAQVLFGFPFNGIFQDLFDELPRLSRALAAAGLTLLMATIGLLVAPSMQHRIGAVFHLGWNTVEQILQGQQPIDVRQPAEEVGCLGKLSLTVMPR